MPFEEKIPNIPDRPGVYIFKGREGEVIYVGKARSLKKRLATWLGERPKHSAWVDVMIRQAADLDYLVTSSEVEALVLEYNLIKEHRPKYNIKLADDKSYPYLKVSLEEPFPRLMLVREVPRGSPITRLGGGRAFHDPKKREVHKLRQGRYFGPFPSAKPTRRTMRLVQELFKLRACKKVVQPGARGTPCLMYHIGRCAGTCAGKITQEEYAKRVEEAVLFLEGKHTEVIDRIYADMEAAAEAMDYERAARLRDKARAVERVLAQQRVVANVARDEDVLGVARGKGYGCVQAFTVRAGKLIDQHSYFLDNTVGHDEAELLEGFLKQYYAGTDNLPKEVLLSEDLDDAEVLSEWLSEQRGAKVRAFRPQRGEKRRLVDMARENAKVALSRRLETEHQRQLAADALLSDLQEALDLERMPRRIEAYDVSNTSGREAVASLVVFEDAQPLKSGYRRFKMRATADRPDDYAMMREALTRRFRRAQEGDRKFAELPDLVLVDGGKGQLNVALEVLGEFGLEEIDAVGLAKEFEDIYRPTATRPLRLPADARSRHLLQRLRDEAHRFARAYHTGLRGRRVKGSLLDQVPGIGPTRRRRLLKRFSSVKRMREASVDELAAVRGMNRKAAAALHSHLHAEESE
ncbi:MAG: excinuclease ABC subunit UvrC [Armatimonadota bacterium]